jgi:hypothetical protein
MISIIILKLSSRLPAKKDKDEFDKILILHSFCMSAERCHYH